MPPVVKNKGRSEMTSVAGTNWPPSWQSSERAQGLNNLLDLVADPSLQIGTMDWQVSIRGGHIPLVRDTSIL